MQAGISVGQRSRYNPSGTAGQNQQPEGRGIQIRWPTIFVESVAIVGSILLAFWIDAWWADSQQREREAIVLQTLLDDLHKMRRQVDAQRTYNEAILAATTELLRAGARAEPGLAAADVDRLLRDVVWYNPANLWESATMDLLVSAGDLADLSDAELVGMLSKLHYRLERAQGRYRLDEAFYRDKLIPFLGVNANLPQILAGIDHAPGKPDWTYEFPDIEFATTRDHTPILSDNEFQGLLAVKVDLQHDILKYTLEDLDDELHNVIVRLEENLAD